MPTSGHYRGLIASFKGAGRQALAVDLALHQSTAARILGGRGMSSLACLGLWQSAPPDVLDETFLGILGELVLLQGSGWSTFGGDGARLKSILAGSSA